MSLTAFLSRPDVRGRLKPLRPRLTRKIGVAVRTEPRSGRYAMVGTAFDYLLRFELQRLAPHATSEAWIAEQVPDMLWRPITGQRGGHVGLDVLHGVADPADYLHPREVARRARLIVGAARAAVAKYVTTATPRGPQRSRIAGHAIRLAKLDEAYRSLRLDPRFEDAAPEDVADLLAMLKIAPFGPLLHAEAMHLNPSFKEASALVGGADADLIAGDLLVDFKVTKKGHMVAKSLDQLLGYLLLARHQREADGVFPEIKRVGTYFCRQAHLWALDVGIWTERPDFRDLEDWFVKKAKETFKPPASPPQPDIKPALAGASA